FYKRFENEEIQLSYAMDTEVGIGYRQDLSTLGVHPYVEDLIIPSLKQKQKLEIKLNSFQILLNQKLQGALLEKCTLINLVDEDLEDFDENWDDLQETMSFMTEIISEGGHEKLYLNHGSGNAGKLLGRFCSEKSDIRNFVKEISLKEQELHSNKILAEIIHLPESRIGNILRRPQIRNYEIPYLGNSTVPKESQISIDDLYLSIRNNKLILRSKRLNKEIVPCLTNAHNYSTNSLPTYHFLCDFSTQDTRSSLLFHWGGLIHIYNFFPRVEYRNIILSKAKWKITLKEINHFASLMNNRKQLMYEIKKWRKKRQIPEWIQWIKSDNTLLINLENSGLVTMFLSSITNEKTVLIEEFLKYEKSDFTNQFVFSIFKSSSK
uniref:lantibiotic dehydratase n=1 Tax=Kaistella sp. TaxID=2782235 RepID=UPI0035A1C9EC